MRMKPNLIAAVLSVASAAGLTLGQPVPPVRPTRPVTAPANGSQTVSGTVDGYELDPHGVVNAVVLKDGERIVQMNVPPEYGGLAVAIAPVGQRATAVGTPVVVVGNRALFELVSLAGPDGKATTLPDRSGPRAVHVEGTIKSLNFGQKGEVNGAVLESGDFVHTGSAAAASLGLAVGQKLDVDGTGAPMPTGHTAVEAARVNGVAVARPAVFAPGRPRTPQPFRPLDPRRGRYQPMNRPAGDDADDGRGGPPGRRPGGPDDDTGPGGPPPVR